MNLETKLINKTQAIDWSTKALEKGKRNLDGQAQQNHTRDHHTSSSCPCDHHQIQV